MQTQLSRYCRREDMFNGQKLTGSCSNQFQPKIFPLWIWSSYPSSALTVENLKRLEEEYVASKEAFKMQRMQDYIEQTNLILFHKETTGRTSRDFVCDAEPDEASLCLPAKQAKIAMEFPEKPLKKEEILSAPAVYSPSAQPTGPVPKEPRLLFQLGKKNRSDSPATVNQHNTTVPTTGAAAATRIYTIWRHGSLLPAAQFKHRDRSNLPRREKAGKGN